jgi:hypothetical protein
MAEELPEVVRRFVTGHIDSVSTLDALLVLRAAPDRVWSASDLGRALVSSETAATRQLHQLKRHGLLAHGHGGFRYAPPPDKHAIIDRLAECYARRRASVIAVIYGADQAVQGSIRPRRTA